MESEMSDAICKNCRYYYSPLDNGAGDCRRYPPQVIFLDSSGRGRESVWPYTSDEAWCGEYAFTFAIAAPKENPT